MKKFILSSQQLKQALHKVGHVIMAKSVLPALSNIYCKVGEKQIEMIASDTETTIVYKTEAETSGESFEFLLPYALISKIVSLASDLPLSFELIKNKLKITGDNDEYELKNLEKVENFPKLQEVPKENIFSIDKEIIGFLKVATQTIGKDEKYPSLMSVLLELRKKQVTIASSDGSFMVFSHTLPAACKSEQDILFKPKVIKAIEDLESGQIFWNDNTVVVEGTNTTVLITRGQYKFPNFRAIIPPDFPSNVTIKRDQLIHALEKCNINSNALKQMDITLSKKGKVAFTAKDTDFGINIFVEIEGDYSGPVDSLRTSSEKMLKLMNQVSYEDIELAIHDKTKPILFRNQESGYLGLLNCLSNQ